MIEVKNIHKIYRMGKIQVKALDDVSLSIAAGEFVAIMGPSGSGKSTLMHILGLLDRADSGSYFLTDKNVIKLSDNEWAVIRNQSIGFIFQQFHLLARISALENAQLPLIYAGKRHLKEKAREEIELVGLANRANHTPSELSGGQQQRAAIARALVNDPLIIFADEPTGNLDSKSKEEILDILKQLNRSGKTIVMVTHEQEIAEHAKRIIFMRDGKIVSDTKLNCQDQECADVLKLRIALKPAQFRGWIKYLEYFHQAWFAMIIHKVRSLLSILGILIGVAAVIAMLALGQGAKESLEKQLSSLGSNLLMMRGGSSKLHGVMTEAGAVTRFTFQDVAAIAKLSGVKNVVPSVNGKGQIVYGNKNWNTQLEGTDVDYAQMRAAMPIEGRFFTKEEVRSREKVAVIGATVARKLFDEVNPVGETIKINLINFKIIGILPVKGANGFRDQDDTILIPITTAMYRLLGKEYIDMITIEGISPNVLEQVQEDIKSVIVRQHRLTKDTQDSFDIRNMADIKNTLENTTKTMSLLLGAIAAISLIVGGIGIMNIMLVSVTERTREIGLRKAIGANNRDIMNQFLIEAVLLSFIGGLCGIGLGIGASILITAFAGWTVVVSPFSIILSAGFSLIIGIVFGLMPAKQAARLDPIEALRYE